MQQVESSLPFLDEFVVALDPKTGKVLWTDGDGGKAGYSTAAVFQRAGKSYVAGMTGTHLRIHDVATK